MQKNSRELFEERYTVVLLFGQPNGQNCQKNSLKECVFV